MVKENSKIKDELAHADSMRDVRVSYVPPNFPEQPTLDCITLNHGQIEKTYRLKNVYGVQTGTRIYKPQRKDLETKPITRYLYFGKYKFSVKYEGQDNTSAYGAEIGHTEKECPQKQQIKTYRIGNLRKIQSEPPNNETRSEPATNQTIQHSSSIPNNNKKTSQSRQNQTRQGQINNSSSQTSARKPDKQPFFTANHHPDNVLHDRNVITIQQSNNSKKTIATNYQNNSAQSSNDKLDESQLPKKQQTRKFKKRVRSLSSSLGQDPKNPNLNQTNEKEIEVGIFSSSSSSSVFSDTESYTFDTKFSELFVSCCRKTAKRCKDSFSKCSCGLRLLKCKCRWRLINTNSPTYECDQCSVTTVKCPFCKAFYVNEDNTRIECTYCHHDYDPIT